VPAASHARSESPGRDTKLKRLLIRPGAIGDTIVWLPAAEACCASAIWCSVPSLIPGARSIASTGLDLLELGIDERAARAMQEFDSIYCWYVSNRPEFRAAVSHFPVEFFSALPEGGCHAVDFYARQVGAPDGLVPRVDAGSVQKRDFIAIHPFSGSPKKNWPLDRYRELARQLPLPAEFTAGPDEALDGAVRYEDLRDLARWLASARLCIGNDSGVSHLAAAVGTPVIAIFQTSDPRVWSPRGRAPVVVAGPSDDMLAHASELLEAL
jgi:heptosyltransferase-3